MWRTEACRPSLVSWTREEVQHVEARRESRDLLTGEESRASLSAPQELKMKSYGIGLILCTQSGAEMKRGDLEKHGGYESSMGNWTFWLDTGQIVEYKSR